MIKIKRILMWSLIAVLFQTGVFFAADKYYEKTVLNTNVTEVRVDKNKQLLKDITINVPSDAKQTEVSYDGKYISYYEQDKLNIINTYDGTKHVVNAEKGFKQVYCKWFPDMNSMVICEKDLYQGRNINIYRYNAENDSKFTPTNSNGKNIKLKLNNCSDKVSDIAISTGMNLWYIRIAKANGRTDIFNIDVNGNVMSLLTSKMIGKIGVFKRMTNLIYESRIDDNVYVKNNSWDSLSKNVYFLNVDDSDNLYIGIVKNNKVVKIQYGSIKKNIRQWKSIDLNEPVDKNNIFITSSGKIYIVDSTKGYITDKLTNKTTSYEGSILGIADKTLITVSNGVLKRKNLN
ncbi:MAG: hypothetical protein K0R54_1088 [Clostridiaceae bacterium]|jgi:hypothetical protein|nr:hypothetical protein [Clostridiaceae bacterium]